MQRYSLQYTAVHSKQTEFEVKDYRLLCKEWHCNLLQCGTKIPMHERSDRQIIAWQICSVAVKVKCPTTVFPPKVSKSCEEGEKVNVVQSLNKMLWMFCFDQAAR